jgi:TRAP-type C4-dicarboxylate transport system permease large subunit
MASTGATVNVTGATSATISPAVMLYLTTLTDQQATYSNATTVTVNAYAAINPVTFLVATKNEFDVYINGQYIDKQVYTWTPSDVVTQTIIFDTVMLGYAIDSTDTVLINGRWS